MAKASINTGVADQPVHTRTTSGSEESQVFVLGTDGNDNVLDPAVLATVAKQDTMISHLDGVESALTAVQTAVQILDNAIAGSEIQADVLTLPAAASATVTQVASSATSVTLQASNAARKGLTVFNDSTQVVRVKFGSSASSTSYTLQVPAGGFWEMPPNGIYTGLVAGIWVSANGNCYVTEF